MVFPELLLELLVFHLKLFFSILSDLFCHAEPLFRLKIFVLLVLLGLVLSGVQADVLAPSVPSSNLRLVNEVLRLIVIVLCASEQAILAVSLALGLVKRLLLGNSVVPVKGWVLSHLLLQR